MNRKQKMLLTLILLTAFYFIPVVTLGNKYSLCIFKHFFHFECLGCGTIRALWSIIHLHFQQAYTFNKLIIFTFPLMCFIYVNWLIHKDKSI